MILLGVGCRFRLGLEDRFSIERVGVDYVLKSLELLDYESDEVVDGTLILSVGVNDGRNAETVEGLVIKVLDKDTRVDDRVEITSSVFNVIDTGEGFDVLAMVGDFDLDLTVIGDNLLRNIEEIEIIGTSGADNVLTMDLGELVAIGGRRLYVTGDSDDEFGGGRCLGANGERYKRRRDL